MYILIDPAIALTPNSLEAEHKQDVVAAAKRIEQQFPANNKLFSVTVDSCADLLYLDQWGPLDAQQVAWLNSSPDITRWSWERGGSLVLVNRTPTVTTFPCHFDYVAGTQVACLDLTLPVSPFFRWKDSTCKAKTVSASVPSDEVFHFLLKQAGIPLSGWTQTLWFCERCDQPKATESDCLCQACEAAQKQFMTKPYQHVQKPSSTLVVFLVLSMLVLHSILRALQSNKVSLVWKK